MKSDWGLSGGSSDPYAIARIPGSGDEIRTDVIKNTLNPEWNCEGKIGIITFAGAKLCPIVIQVMDKDMLNDEFMGICSLDYSKCVENPGEYKINNVSYLLQDPENKLKKDKVKGEIFISVKFEKLDTAPPCANGKVNNRE